MVSTLAFVGRLTDLGSVSSGHSKGLQYRISTSSHQYKTTAPAMLQLAKVTNSLGTGLASAPPSPDERYLYMFKE